MIPPALVHDHVAEEYVDYLRDESRRTGQADGIAFPLTVAEVAQALAAARERGWPVTVQGARTGVTGGAVPDAGLVINFSRMHKILRLRRHPAGDGRFLLTVQPGLLLQDLRARLAAKTLELADPSGTTTEDLESFQAGPELFFPPDPTETTASLGGMAACNASGACSFSYGATRRYIQRLRLLLNTGAEIDLERGQCAARGREFSLPTVDGQVLAGRIPSYTMPAVKSAAGYFAAENMDLLDLFIGAEGTLGLITELELVLIPTPPMAWGIMAFMPSQAAALALVRGLRGDDSANWGQPPGLRPAAIEFFDAHALELLRRHKDQEGSASELPDLPPDFHTAIYVELHARTEPEIEAAVEAVAALIDQQGGNEDATWLASDAEEMHRLHLLRHAVPEYVNQTIDERRRAEPKLTKLGTDMAVPDDRLEWVMDLYQQGLAASGLEFVIFGHIGNNHVHVNILPRSLAEYQQARGMYLQWAAAIVAVGGTVSAEHGIGKIKTALLRQMLGDQGIREMQEVKKLFDPMGMLNPGNLFGQGA